MHQLKARISPYNCKALSYPFRLGDILSVLPNFRSKLFHIPAYGLTTLQLVEKCSDMQFMLYLSRLITILFCGEMLQHAPKPFLPALFAPTDLCFGGLASIQDS